MRQRTRTAFLLILCLAAAALSSCRLSNLERKLPPAAAQFLGEVRYLITPAERKTFLEMPDADRAAFIEQFWKRRDPDPSTQDNELKIEYYARLERASTLFRGEGFPGWQTDRGRMFILYGPPTERVTQPLGSSNISRCQEVWYYGSYPVVFLDRSCTGSFKLATYDLSPLQDLNIAQSGLGGRPPAGGLPGARDANVRVLEFATELTILERSPKRVAASFRASIPYERIWFRSEGKMMRTTFTVTLELRDAKKDLVWEGSASGEAAVAESELANKAGTEFVLTVPIVITDEAKVAALGRTGSVLGVSIVNATGGETLKKTIDFL